MRILLVHNRYRSAAPSGENRVVDQEGEALAALGHEVVRFGRSSDEIEQWSVAKKASLPVRTIWSRETRHDLEAVLREHRPERRPRPQHVSSAQRGCALCLPRCAGSCCGHDSQLQAGVRQRYVLPQWSCLPRLCSRPARSGGPAWLLPGIACGHCARRTGHGCAPAGMEIAGIGVHIHLSITA